VAGESIDPRVELLLADARAASQAGDRARTQALASAVLALDPGNAEAEVLRDGSDQRCQMTLMFCDLVGSTALADQIDPEELSAILRDYRATCTAVIERYGGFIEDRKGDGLLVRFGYPWVHEDDARRAVLSGLEIVQAIGAHELDLHLRIAVHTGLVVTDGGEVVGAAPNEAARLQSLAEPDTVLISDATYALVSDCFDVESRGVTDLRGVSRPFELFTVLGERECEPLDESVRNTPFADRDGERRLIAEMWSATCAREPGAVTALLVTAPAGMGKSRLVLESARTLNARLLCCHCSSFHQTTSLHPFQRVLEQICAVTNDDGPVERLAKLRARLGIDAPGQDLPALATALSIPPDALAPPVDVESSRLHSIAMHAAAQLLRATSDDGPVLLLVDDLQWADESSLLLISILLAEPAPGLLLALTARAGFAAPWPPDALRHLQLGPLSVADLEEMARGMAESTGLADARQRELIARSDGVPLFLEELVRSGSALDAGAGQAGALRQAGSGVPAALRDPLLARLVHPRVDLALAQIASTIGRDVDRELLQRVSGLDDMPFQAKLANLVATGLVIPGGDGTIRFRHGLIREVAYETQRRSACRERHSRIADLLREGSARRRADAGELAFHLEQAQRTPEAIEAHTDAARVHQSLGAHKEAIAKLTHVLGLVEQLPTGAPRLLGELTARQLRSFSAVMTGGYSAPETAQDHARCVELCEHLGLVPELLPSLILSWSFYCSRGDLAEAERVTATMERVIGESGLSSPATELARGVEGFFRGRLEESHALLESFVAHPWGQSTDAPPAGWPLPNDPVAAVLSHLIFTTWMRGDRAGAKALEERALQRVGQLGFPFGPFTAGYVKSQLAVLRRLEHDHAAAGRLAGEMIELGDRHGIVMWTVAGHIQRLISQVHGGETAALEPLAATIVQWRELLSVNVYLSYWLTELAAAQMSAGRMDDARTSLDEAVAVARATGSDWYSAETLRLRGVLRCEAGDRGGRDDLDEALAKARSQRALEFESRVAAALELEGTRTFAAG
jgi:class 3 adenylate cyclase